MITRSSPPDVPTVVRETDDVPVPMTCPACGVRVLQIRRASRRTGALRHRAAYPHFADFEEAADFAARCECGRALPIPANRLRNWRSEDGEDVVWQMYYSNVLHRHDGALSRDQAVPSRTADTRLIDVEYIRDVGLTGEVLERRAVSTIRPTLSGKPEIVRVELPADEAQRR